ncbi:MAG: inositol monophosphatase [Draconibacterium sp.]|nr:MAG: inositol monophosphatase [Draconibacterium sp.]
MDYKNLCASVCDLACQTGHFIRQEQKKLSGNDIQIKSTASLVTYVDKTAEERLVSALKKMVPNAGFVAEEGTAQWNNEKYVWIVDPLDGTTNYIHGISPYSVSIALRENNELVVGVVYEIGQDELFYAWKGSAAFLNGREILVSKTPKLEDTLIGTGFPYYDFDRVDNYIDAMKELMGKTRGLRRFGSAAVDLAYVACGRFDAFFEHALHAWDVAAGAFILEQAGGKVTDFNGGENWLFGGEIIAASNATFDPFYEIINRNLGYIP